MSVPLFDGFTVLKDLSVHTPAKLYARWLVKDDAGRFFLFTGGLHGDTPSIVGIPEEEARQILTMLSFPKR